MTLRLRLLLGYGYLVALLLLATGSAMLGFLHLSQSVEEVLVDNFASIDAAMRMLEALERQDSATLAALLERPASAAEMAAHERDFLDALERAEGNVTEEAERPVLERVRSGYEEYRRAREELLATQPESPLRAYDTRVFPAFSAAKRGVLELLVLNHRAMIEADRATRQAAIQNGAWLGFLVAVALVSLVFLSRALQRRLLSRLADLRQGMGAITGGELHRRLRDDEADELGAIARHFNQLLDQLQQVEARMRGRLSHERQAVLGLVRHLGGGAAVYDLSGRLLVGSGEELFSGRLPDELMDWIEEEGSRRIDALGDGDGGGGITGPSVIEVDERPMRIELLLASPTRPVGWLVRQEE